MRLSIFLLLAALHVSARTVSQTVTLNCDNTPLAAVLKEVKKQTGMVFIYNEPVGKEYRVTVKAENMQLNDFLQKVLTAQGLQYSIKSKTIAVFKNRAAALPPAVDYMLQAAAPPFTLRGRVIDSLGRPIAGAAVLVKGSKQGFTSDADGKFLLKDAPLKGVLIITFTGFETREIAWNGNDNVGSILLKEAVSQLSEIQIVAYGEVKRKYLTSNISRVSGDELAKQPVGNPLQALEGRVPGMVVSQTTGVSSARVNVQVRGRSSFDNNLSSDQPLFVIDGVPMAANNDKVNAALGPFGAVPGTDGLSAFAGLNAADIASIDVLKDADATAIYGSRGANGVILITTRKAKAGKLRINANVSTGVNAVSRIPQMLNTQQYLEMRNEAFKNDNATKTNTNAYDLLLWDQNRYTDFARLLIGNNAPVTNAQVSLSGGNKQTQVRMGAGYYKEGSVWPGDKYTDRFSANIGTRTVSEDEKFILDFSAIYSVSKNNLVAGDLAAAVLLPPNFRLYNDDGSLSWSEGGYSTANAKDNPLAALNQVYLSDMSNLNANLTANYKITSELTAKASLGYNTTLNDDRRINPIAAQNPFKANLAGQSTFGNTKYKNWIFEPQLEYNKIISKGKLNVLAGATLNKRENSSLLTVGNGYASDDLLASLTGATTIAASNNLTKYSYQAFFGRVNYIHDEKYVVNFTGRRDGSSRFGPEYRFSTFGAVGAAWLFSNERFFSNSSILSFGKLRGSYGITGNDQIGDYSYIDTWAAGSTYGDSATLAPSKVFMPLLHWEGNIKTELGLELGFLNDRILFTASAYRNVSSDPLVYYPLPATAGFASMVNNLNGVKVENKGLEITLSSKNIRAREAGAFSWSTDFNITLPKNKLLAFPDLERSSYAAKYVLGQPLNQAVAAQFQGVDPATGLYTVADLNKDGVNGSADFAGTFTTDPKYYGGLNNSFSYKRFNLSFFLQFTKQIGKSWKTNNLYNPPGTIFNVPVEAMARWQSEGQQTDVQKFTTSPGSITGLSGFYAFMLSGGQYTDASFVRLKNVNLSYDMPAKWLKALRMSSLRVYMQGQNLFLITGYKGGDPETQTYTRIAPLRTITAGVQLTL